MTRRAPRVPYSSASTRATRLAAGLGFRARVIVIADYRIDALASWAQAAGVDGVCVEHFLLSPALVGTLRASGLCVSTGTINHPALLRRLLPLGLDAVTSDSPAELLAALTANELSALGGLTSAPSWCGMAYPVRAVIRSRIDAVLLAPW